MKLAILCAALAVAAIAQDKIKLPEGEGKAQLEKICSMCHELDTVVGLRNTKDGWNKVVDEMVGRGAEGSDQDLELIVEYLAKNFPRKVNANKASAADLVATLAISKETATAIVSEREKNGPYKQWDDLKRVPGLDLKKIEDKKNRVEF